MEQWGYSVIADILEGVASSLRNPESVTRKQFHLSREQFATLIGMIRIATSPACQMLTINGVAKRWNKTPRTIRNWIDQGLVREGYKKPGDNQLYWLTSELDEDERNLYKLGYISKSHNHRVHYFIDMLNGFLHDGKYDD